MGGGLAKGRLFCCLATDAHSIRTDDDLPQHEGLEARVAAAILPVLGGLGYELVRVQVSGKERPVVQIMADRADEAPFRVEDCEAISHAVGAVLDVEDPISGEWTLEVSSPGIDRPLTRTKDWNRYVGHVATLELALPVEGRRRFKGIVLGADADAARLKLEDGTDMAFPRGNLRRAKLVLTDALIAASQPPGSEDEIAEEEESPPSPKPKHKHSKKH
jgi:ribosome maturation factor RimP